jgi:hypothetical protein
MPSGLFSEEGADARLPSTKLFSKQSGFPGRRSLPSLSQVIVVGVKSASHEGPANPPNQHVSHGEDLDETQKASPLGVYPIKRGLHTKPREDESRRPCL